MSAPPHDLPSLLKKFETERARAADLAAEQDAIRADESRPDYERDEAASFGSFYRGSAMGWECAAINVQHVIRGAAAEVLAVYNEHQRQGADVIRNLTPSARKNL